MARSAIMSVRITGNSDDAVKAFSKVTGKAAAFGSFMGGINMISSTAISREGTNAYFMKFIPVPVETQAFAKAACGIIISAVSGWLLLIPLQPVLQSPALQPAFDNVVPALFGAMAYKYYRKNMKIALWPLVLMSVLFILVPGLLGSTSFMILPSGAIAIGVAYFRYRRSRKETAA